MANRELDERIARAMGWTQGCVGLTDESVWFPPGDRPQWAAPPFSHTPLAPPFSHMTSLLEDEIEKRGLGYEYIEALIALVNVPDLHLDQWPKFDDIFKIKRATPEQCARAFLKAIND